MIKVVKLRDLTDEEISQLCDKHFKRYRTCFECPLKLGDNSCMKIINLDTNIEVEYGDKDN